MIVICLKCGTKNRISTYSIKLIPVCAKCRNELPETISARIKKTANKFKYWIIIAFIAGGATIKNEFYNSNFTASTLSSSAPVTNIPYESNPAHTDNSVINDLLHTAPANVTTYLRPAFDPNGQPWTRSAHYLIGYKKLHTNGHSIVTVDNSNSDSDVYVKLVSLDANKAYPVRHFFIPAYSKFKLHNVRSGNYDVRYKNLDTGYLSRSESFYLEEINKDDGIQYSDLTMTLYKVANGNMQTYPLSESEF